MSDLKSSALYFGRELMSYFGISQEVVRLLPTEQIHLEAVRMTDDIKFEMKDGTIAHFEFESSKVDEDDLRRYREYDAHTGRVYRKAVITYVVCSGNVHSIQSELREGINTYKVIPLHMKGWNADTLFEEMDKMVKGNSTLERKDIAPLLLTPLMSGDSLIKDRVKKVLKLLEYDNTLIEREDKARMQAVMYTFACKFLSKVDLDDIKEVFGMTVLGEMIWNDGLEKGLEKGLFIKVISCTRNQMKRGIPAVEIADFLEEDVMEIRDIIQIITICPDCTDEEIYKELRQGRKAAIV